MEFRFHFGAGGQREAQVTQGIHTAIENLREGVRAGYTSPRGNVEAVIEQLDGLLASPPERSPVLLLAERDQAAADLHRVEEEEA